VKSSAETVLGRRRGTNKECWISSRTWNLIDKRKEAKIKRDQARTRGRQQALSSVYRDLDKEVKKSSKLDRKDWIKTKCCEAEAAADRNDTRMLYSAVRQLTGVNSNSNVPVKSKDGRMLLTEEEHWMEHFKEVLNQPEPTIWKWTIAMPAKSLKST